MSSFENLVYWQKARQLTKEIYIVTANFPKTEVFCLTSQMRRAAISISSNIAEGYGRQYRSDYIHFLNIARGSCFELESQLVLSTDLDFLTPKQSQKPINLCIEIGKMLNAAIQSLQRKK